MNSPYKHHFGYAKELERPDQIDECGIAPELILQTMRASFPTFNPQATPWNVLTDQGQQGSCAGHAGAHITQVMVVQSFASLVMFSRGGCYYEAQRKDNISGDKGSTLAGVQKVLSVDGICLEEHWPYPTRYNPTRPANHEVLPKVRLKSSKTIKDADLIWDLLDAGAAIQTGVNWNASFDQPVCNTLSTRQGGGHSTMLYGTDSATGHAVHHNSWANWQNNQRNLWTLNFLKEIVAKDRWATFVAYQAVDVQVDDGILPTPEIG